MRKSIHSRRIKVPAFVTALLLVLLIAIGGTVAYLSVTTPDVVNTFEPATVSCKVNETLTDNVKSNVTIQNTGNVDAFIRAMVIINWIKLDGSVCGTVHEVVDETFNLGTNWVKNGDFYYYTQKVPAGGNTSSLIDSYTLQTSEVDGCTMQVVILASAIQADALGDYSTAWSTAASKKN